MSILDQSIKFEVLRPFQIGFLTYRVGERVYLDADSERLNKLVETGTIRVLPEECELCKGFGCSDCGMTGFVGSVAGHGPIPDRAEVLDTGTLDETETEFEAFPDVPENVENVETHSESAEHYAKHVALFALEYMGANPNEVAYRKRFELLKAHALKNYRPDLKPPEAYTSEDFIDFIDEAIKHARDYR
jgi:hypothetical protein